MKLIDFTNDKELIEIRKSIGARDHDWVINDHWEQIDRFELLSKLDQIGEVDIPFVKVTINEIDKTEKPTIILFNKIDAYQAPKNDNLVEDLVEITTLESLKKSWMAKMNKTKSVFISAQDNYNIEEFKAVLYEEVKSIFRIRYPYNDFLF